MVRFVKSISGQSPRDASELISTYAITMFGGIQLAKFLLTLKDEPENAIKEDLDALFKTVKKEEATPDEGYIPTALEMETESTEVAIEE